MGSNYGRHVTVLQSPQMWDRLGRYRTGDAEILQWMPVRVPDGAVEDANGRLPLELCTGATEPVKTRHGLICWETPDANFPGFDPMLTKASDFSMVPANTGAQLVSGAYVRVEYRNIAASTFQYQRDYPARKIVDGIGEATPTVEPGVYLTPGVGDDTDGYWAVTATKAEAWLVVTEADNDLAVVQAQMLF